MNRQTVLVGCLVTLLFALLWERRADVWSLINTTPAYAQTGVATPNLSPEAAVGTGFTYQGQLTSGGTTVNDTCDFEFRLFDAASGGTQQGSTLTSSGVGVANGLFTVSLDFGAGHFLGQARWLEAAVRCPVGSGGFTTLSPRQALSPTPNALFAAGAGTLVHPGFTILPPIPPPIQAYSPRWPLGGMAYHLSLIARQQEVIYKWRTATILPVARPQLPRCRVLP